MLERPSSAASLPDRVRSAAAAVAQRSTFVTIDDRALAAYAATIPVEQACRPTLAPGDLPAVDRAGLVAWVVTVNAVNFGSGFFPVLAKRPGLSGSRSVFACLQDRFDRQGPLTVDDLRAATVEGCTALFEQEPGGPATELMAWFASAWRSLGEALADRWDGSFEDLVASAEGSAATLAELLAGIDGWDDVAEHGGEPVPLFKRAQITGAHLAMAFAGTGPGRFDDLDRLTIFADNLVPHVLRVDGVLRFEPDLVARIEAGELLAPGSPEEVEIRAVAVHASELLVQQLRADGHPATAMGLDQVLWSRGGEPRYKARPRHRARTTAY
ncbi:queuosine salvage family protein [Aquihabitans sp. G128]|uniref:queuosine salvage family protein n=1 Tax=Aquihabitans sp. G128 TaxID=2849779 RepID=UPI001C24FB3E|nr:queuosine salvage family protein [Aquihabitans sp. G128]QXC63217.1 queuosine salvage family protein [Aquihabitans sp. G128]